MDDPRQERLEGHIASIDVCTTIAAVVCFPLFVKRVSMLFFKHRVPAGINQAQCILELRECKNALRTHVTGNTEAVCDPVSLHVLDNSK